MLKLETWVNWYANTGLTAGGREVAAAAEEDVVGRHLRQHRRVVAARRPDTPAGSSAFRPVRTATRAAPCIASPVNSSMAKRLQRRVRRTACPHRGWCRSGSASADRTAMSPNGCCVTSVPSTAGAQTRKPAETVQQALQEELRIAPGRRRSRSNGLLRMQARSVHPSISCRHWPGLVACSTDL